MAEFFAKKVASKPPTYHPFDLSQSDIAFLKVGLPFKNHRPYSLNFKSSLWASAQRRHHPGHGSPV